LKSYEILKIQEYP